ncbi:Protein IQ-DOMAIN 31 [Rhynchospora pubera]|uniref:Protein IQ-DOMAIN 31 n=1 Tax=Rhynchospora pubera TaxID=906938 RepID=A0AAV8C2S9_9POAL|nr:Protein IQ-DOMAIN 31 [Rhynchospora pubera]
MGKSPGKWLKTLLFGKKSFRSSSTRSKNSSEKGLTKTNTSSLGDNSPIISEPVLISTYGNTTLPIVEETHPSDLHGCETTIPVSSQAMVDELSDCVKLSEEKAATKAQAAIRGFLARRAFLALKGILRLQALIRGHLVRRQAVATLYAMHAIVRVQAMMRGRSARCSDMGIQIKYTKARQDSLLNCKSGDAWKENFPDHSLGHKLLFSRVAFKPLQIQLDKEDPNSATNWLERWHVTHFWKPIMRAKDIADSQPQQRKSKSSTSGQSIKTNPKLAKKKLPNSEPEKRKNNYHSKTPEVAKPEQEKPKQGLRKASISILDAEISKLSSGLKKSNSKTVQEVSKNSETASKTVLAANPSEMSLYLSSNGESAKKVIHKRRSSISTQEAPEKELQACSTTIKTMPHVSTSEGKSLSGNRDSDAKSNNRRRSSPSTTKLEMPEIQLHASKTVLGANLSEVSPSLLSNEESAKKVINKRKSPFSTQEAPEKELQSSTAASKAMSHVSTSEEKQLSGNRDSDSKSNNRRRSSPSTTRLEMPEIQLHASKIVLGANLSEVSPSLLSNEETAKKVINKRKSSISTQEAPEKELQSSTAASKAMPHVSTSEEKSLSGNRDSDSKSNNRRRSSPSTTRLEMPEIQFHASVSSTASKTMPDVNCPEEKSLSNSGDSGNKSNHRRRSSLSTTKLEIPKSELHASVNACTSKITPDVNSSEEKSFSSNGESGYRSSNRRRSSFSAGLEIHEAELSSSASKSVPSYMATTESAKARLRGQNSPRVITTPDSADKNGVMRRHSLPSGSANGKLKSISPRTQKPLHSASTKGVIKGERSLNLSRDGSVKSLHAEWRR